MFKSKLLIYVLISLTIASCTSISAKIHHSSLKTKYIEDIITCDKGDKNYTINPAHINIALGFFDGDHADTVRVQYANSRNWTQFSVPEASISMKGLAYGYIDILRRVKPNTDTYELKAKYDSKTLPLTECRKLKKWGTLNRYGELLPSKKQ